MTKCEVAALADQIQPYVDSRVLLAAETLLALRKSCKDLTQCEQTQLSIKFAEMDGQTCMDSDKLEALINLLTIGACSKRLGNWAPDWDANRTKEFLLTCEQYLFNELVEIQTAGDRVFYGETGEIDPSVDLTKAMEK